VASCAIEWVDPPPNVTGAVEAAHLGAAIEEIYGRHGVAFDSATMHRAFRGLAHDNPFDPKREWLEEQPYDGGNRIERVFLDCFGIPLSPYSQAVARNLFLGIARRVLNPGCQHDEVTVLEGLEGQFKSTFFRLLGGEWHGEIKQIDNDDYVQLISRCVVAELGELSALRRADDARFKQIVTSHFDLHRPKYAIGAIAHPRSCVFVGTVNPPPGQGRYLTSTTGNRRFLPLYVPQRLDVAAARELLPLCLGEARERALAGEPWAEVPGARDEQAARELVDPWFDSVADILANQEEVSLGLLCSLMEIAPERRQSFTYTRLEHCLTRLGWQLTNRTNKQRLRLWGKPKELDA